MTDILKLSDTSSLALHAMALLARHPQERYSSGRIAQILGASEHTLSKVMRDLVAAGFIDSVRGAQGGFQLLVDPVKVSMRDIHEAVDGPMRPQKCLLGKPACTGKKCVMQDLMGKLHRELYEYFDGTTLADLAASIRIGDI